MDSNVFKKKVCRIAHMIVDINTFVCCDYRFFPYPKKKDVVGLFYYCFVEFEFTE